MTDEQAQQYRDKIEANIKKYGYNSTFVFAGNSPSFCYSTGIYKSFGVPEIFISSLPQNLSHELIADYLAKFRNTNSVPVNEQIDDLTDRFPVYLIEVPKDNLTEYVLTSLKFYGNTDFKYVQLIYPDVEGNFPNDTGYDYDQEIIGEFRN